MLFGAELHGGDLHTASRIKNTELELNTRKVKVKVKVKFTLEQATMAHRRSRGIALLFR